MADIALDPDLLVGPLMAIGIGMARPMGLALVVPVFTRMDVGLPIRAGFAMALALPNFPPLLHMLQMNPPPTMRLAFLGAKEAVAGILLGLLFGLPIWAMQSAGELLDTQRSAPSSGGNDPGTGGQMSGTAGLISTTASTLFVVAGGLGTMAAAIYSCFSIWPLLRMSPHIAPGATGVALAMLDQFTSVMVMTAAPIMLAMLMADAAVILVGKAVPKLGIFDIAATLRNLVFVGAMVLYAVFLMDVIKVQLGMLQHAGARMQELVKP